MGIRHRRATTTVTEHRASLAPMRRQKLRMLSWAVSRMLAALVVLGLMLTGAVAGEVVWRYDTLTTHHRAFLAYGAGLALLLYVLVGATTSIATTAV